MRWYERRVIWQREPKVEVATRFMVLAPSNQKAGKIAEKLFKVKYPGVKYRSKPCYYLPSEEDVKNFSLKNPHNVGTYQK